jgi:CHAT domain-containing protein/tetratricopeptide (TPR) repeat protein
MMLAAAESRKLRVPVPASMVKTLSVEQTAGVVNVLVSNRESKPAPPTDAMVYANPAGLHSKIQLLLSSALGSEQIVTIANTSKKPATVVIQVGPAAPATTIVQSEQHAEDAFAHAESLRLVGAKGDAAEALSNYDRAIDLWGKIENRQSLARALIWKSYFLFFNRNDYAAALPVTALAQSLIPDLDLVEAANCWKIIGFVNAQLAHYDAGVSAYRTALSLFEQTDDLFNQEVVLDNLSKVERLEGVPEAALADATKAATLADRIGDARRQLGIQEEIGAIDLTEGNLQGAYIAYDRALPLLGTVPDSRVHGYVWSDMGVLYTLLGDLDRAQNALDQAGAEWERNPNPPGEINTLDDYGDLLLERKQPEKAREYYRRGMELAEKTSIDRARIFLLKDIGKSYLQQGQLTQAEENLNRALALAHAVNEGDSVAETLCLLGDVALRRKDFDHANQEYGQCRLSANSTHDAYATIRAEGGLADAAYREGRLEFALSHSDSALDDIEALRGRLLEQDLKTLFFASLHSYYDLDIQILERLAREYPQSGYQWRAFLTAERARTRSLLDDLSASKASATEGISSAQLTRYDAVGRQLRRSEAAAVHGDKSAARAVARLTILEHQLRPELLDVAGSSDVSPLRMLTRKALQDALSGDHEILIEYWAGEQASYAWRITHAGIRSFRLPPAAQIEQECMKFRDSLSATALRDPQLSAEQRAAIQPQLEARWHQQGWQLATTLFPSGLWPPSASTAIVVGDGAIQSVSFGALMNSSPALGDVTFIHEPSAAILLVLERKAVSPHPMRLAVFTSGGKADAGAADSTRASSSSDGSAHLQFTGQEAQTIRSVFGESSTRTFYGASLSPAFLRSLDWTGITIGHFSMHAVLNDRYAELTGLSSGVGRSSDQAMLWYGDVHHLYLPLDLVVLSACNTALGKGISGEGLVGLTQAFFAAGARRVLGTLWAVDDHATSVWMQYFYRALQQTRSPAASLHIAQRRMAADPHWSAPFYWAGFELAGDPRPLH